MIAAIALVLFVPAGLQVLVQQGASQLSARAEATPLLIGARGSEIELVLSALYFDTEPPASLPMSEVHRVRESGLAREIPIHSRFRARGFPIVGTTLNYFEFRNLEVARGRQITMLGECVLGAKVAAQLNLKPGDALKSTAKDPFNLAGKYPLKMHVVGVFEPMDGPDDLAVFVDLKTAWVIEGFGHGHQDLTATDAQLNVLKTTESSVTANAAVQEYTEITTENIDSFHFHGDKGTFPVTAIIAVPQDEKSGTLLRGKYLAEDDPAQSVIPTGIVDQLLATILSVRTMIMAAAAVISLATFVIVVLVFELSVRLRKRELQTMHRLGCSRRAIASMISTEIAVVVVTATVIALGLAVLTSMFAATAIRWFVL
jgi:putative ABC transport system permease protein